MNWVRIKKNKIKSPLIVFQKCGSSRDDLGWIHKKWIHNKNRSQNHLKMNKDNVFRPVLYIYNHFLLLMIQRDMNRKLQNPKSVSQEFTSNIIESAHQQNEKYCSVRYKKKRKGNKCKLDREQNDSSSIFKIEEILQITRFVIEWNELQHWCLFWYH